MAEIKIMSERAVKYVKENIDQLLVHYRKQEDPEIWISELIGEPAFIKANYIVCNDFDFVTEKINSSATELENIRRLYLNLKHISDSFAGDERLWAGLSHTTFLNFIRLRWPEKGDTKSEVILNHYFFSKKGQRSLMLNTLARYWWLGRKTFRQEWNDPWRITNYIGRDIVGYGFSLMGSNWANNEKNLDIFFRVLFRYEEQGLYPTRLQFLHLMRFMNCLCGIYLPEICDSANFEDQLNNFAKKYIFKE